MKNHRWVVMVLTSFLIGGSFLGPLGKLYAAPAKPIAKAVEQAPVSINQADTNQLVSIRGIGPMLAERIVQDRKTNGRFERLEDLVRVPGIGQAKFEKIKSQITL